MKTFLCDIYRPVGDSRYTPDVGILRAVLQFEGEASLEDACAENRWLRTPSDYIKLKLVRRDVLGIEKYIAELADAIPMKWYEFGGSFVWSPSDRFCDEVSPHPIAVFDHIKYD